MILTDKIADMQRVMQAACELAGLKELCGFKPPTNFEQYKNVLRGNHERVRAYLAEWADGRSLTMKSALEMIGRICAWSYKVCADKAQLGYYEERHDNIMALVALSTEAALMADIIFYKGE